MANHRKPHHWEIPLRRHRPVYLNALDQVAQCVPIVEKTSGKLVCAVAYRTSQPYTLATARAIVQANNRAVNAARKEQRDRTPQDRGA